jgi:nucleoside-diphosphate-sugar epimerase
LCPTLLAAGHRVIAVDSFRYGNYLSLAACCADPNFELVRGDVRDANVMRPLLKRADVVVPLAALVGAPLCALCPDEAKAVNEDAVRWLVQGLSPEQMVVFPNTNSGYGAMPPGSDAPLDEDAPLTPISLYGRTKCRAEEYVRWHKNSVVFRLATVFGASPRMRTDLLANDMTLRAHRDGFVMLFDPDARRNFVHCRDVTDAFAKVIDCRAGTDSAMWREGVYNLGCDSANVTKLELCQIIKRHVPRFTWAIGEGHDPDARDYVISNARLSRAGFEAQRTLDDGVRELLKLYAGFPQTQWGNV